MINSPHRDAKKPSSGTTHSRFVKRVRERYASLSNKLDPGILDKEILSRSYGELSKIFPNPPDALRVLRQLALERIATLDCEGNAGLEQITQMMTLLAEWTLCKAYELGFEQLSTKYGVPQTPLGTPATFWIIGMGKLGAGELNVSSDIDLIYIYDHEGETQQGSPGATPPLERKQVSTSSSNASLNASPAQIKVISNQDFYTQLVFEIQRLIDAVTEHGRVFRIDLALRPNGMSGPAVMCLDALEQYLQSQGREWERFAWLKSRVVAPHTHPGLPKELSQIVTPFVYRKYLDYEVFDSLRFLHQQIRAQALRFALGRPERVNDIKLGRGGIREIEFITQLLQVVRGGQFPELRVRPTLTALSLLVQTRQMSEATANQLQSAYLFLRRLEHRIQYLDDQQTHLLPTSPADLEWLSESMGFGSTHELLLTLEGHRSFVSSEFASLLGTKEAVSTDSNDHQDAQKILVSNAQSLQESQASLESNQSNESNESGERVINLLPLGISNNSPLVERVNALLNHPRTHHLKDSSKTKLHALIRQTALWVANDPAKETGALRWCDWMELLLRRENYLSLLIERPFIHHNLIYILGASRWASQYLNLHPGLIDDLADPQVLLQRFNPAQFESTLIQRIDALEESGDIDEEALLNLLRRAHHSELFLCLARDLSGKLSIQEVADDLSALAESVIHITAKLVWRRIKNPHTLTPSFGIVGYGKLGGKELGYGSDLDIVFIYDDPHPNAGETYSSFARKMINWLSVKTTAGDLYEIDTALRPNGNSGLLVTQLAAFEDYQLQRGSNVAWLWEHQAMTRARVILGNTAFRERFESIRNRVLTTQRDLGLLKSEIVGMRNKLIQAQKGNSGLFDLKYSPGAMIDVEFAVQFLILAFSHKHRELTLNTGNLALLDTAAKLGLIAQDLAQSCIQSYKNYRQAQHLARLDERNLKFKNNVFQNDQTHVLRLWNFLFADSTT